MGSCPAWLSQAQARALSTCRARQGLSQWRHQASPTSTSAARVRASHCTREPSCMLTCTSNCCCLRSPRSLTQLPALHQLTSPCAAATAAISGQVSGLSSVQYSAGTCSIAVGPPPCHCWCCHAGRHADAGSPAEPICRGACICMHPDARHHTTAEPAVDLWAPGLWLLRLLRWAVLLAGLQKLLTFLGFLTHWAMAGAW